MNPIVAVPAPMLHVAAASKPVGAEPTVQDVSVVKPATEPVTAVPMGPEVGVRARASRGPTLARNVALAVSPMLD